MSDLYSLMNEGNRFIEREEWERAFDVLRRAEQLDEDNLEVVHGLATVTFHIGKFADASRYYRRLVDLGPSSSELLAGLGSCCFHLGRHEVVIDLCQRAVLLDPQEYDGYCYGVAAALLLRQFEIAEDLAARGLRWFPDDLELHANRGIAAFHSGEDELARRELERALEIDSGRAQLAAYLLRLADGRGETPASESSVEGLEAHFARGCACGEDSALLHLWMGEAYRRRGLLLPAAERFKEASRIDPELSGPSGGLAKVFVARGAPRRAIACWHRELDIDPTRPEVLAGLGETHEMLGERRAAASCFREAASMAGSSHPRFDQWCERVQALDQWVERFSQRAPRLHVASQLDSPGPSPCRYCGKRLSQVLPRGSLCRACQLGTRAGALLMITYVVNLGALLFAGTAILLGQAELFVAAGGIWMLAASGLTSVGAVLVTSFAHAELVSRSRAGGLVLSAWPCERRELSSSLVASLSLVARGSWLGPRTRSGRRAPAAVAMEPKDASASEDAVSERPGRVSGLLSMTMPFAGALAVLPLAALLLFLAPLQATVLGVIGACALLFGWGLASWVRRDRGSSSQGAGSSSRGAGWGPRALLRSFLGDLLAGEGRVPARERGGRADESLHGWDAETDAEADPTGSGPPRRGRMTRVSVAAVLLAILVLLGGWSPSDGSSFEASWPALFSFLETVPYLALLLLGMILALAVDDLEAGSVVLGDEIRGRGTLGRADSPAD